VGKEKRRELQFYENDRRKGVETGRLQECFQMMRDVTTRGISSSEVAFTIQIL
jgi:hypothetical protein